MCNFFLELLSNTPILLSSITGTCLRHTIALQCKYILENHDIHDVHCEIRESVVDFCTNVVSTASSTGDSIGETGSTTDISATFQLCPVQNPPSDNFTHEYVDISDCIGTKIAMKHMDFMAGTKGLYLSLPPSSASGEPTILALTCRHVVMKPETDGMEQYDRQNSISSKEVIQIDQPTYKRTIKRLERRGEYYQERPNGNSEGL